MNASSHGALITSASKDSTRSSCRYRSTRSSNNQIYPHLSLQRLRCQLAAARLAGLPFPRPGPSSAHTAHDPCSTTSSWISARCCPKQTTCCRSSLLSLTRAPPSTTSISASYVMHHLFLHHLGSLTHLADPLRADLGAFPHAFFFYIERVFHVSQA